MYIHLLNILNILISSDLAGQINNGNEVLTNYNVQCFLCLNSSFSKVLVGKRSIIRGSDCREQSDKGKNLKVEMKL